jgi:hypothetical protein
MSTNDVPANLRKSKEEEYFRQVELESIEKMRRQAELEADRRLLAQAAGVADEEIVEQLEALGYTHQNVVLLHLVPLVQVAWADGNVTNRERRKIAEASQLLGVTEGSLPYRQLMNWLDHQPSEEFFEKTLWVIRRKLKTLTQEEQKDSRRKLMFHCTTVASASGSFWGIGSKICQAEKRLLWQIAVGMECDHKNPNPKVFKE